MTWRTSTTCTTTLLATRYGRTVSGNAEVRIWSGYSHLPLWRLQQSHNIKFSLRAPPFQPKLSDLNFPQGKPQIRDMTCTHDAYGVTAQFRLHNKPVSALWEFSKVSLCWTREGHTQTMYSAATSGGKHSGQQPIGGFG